MKSQIALEYMIVFSFVMVVFVFLFALVVVQRSQVMSTQLFQQEQLLAQDIAAHINQALQAGNGYVAEVPVISEIGTFPISVYLTKSGEIIVNASVGKQAVVAVAFTSAQIVSNSNYWQGNKYEIPVSSGALTLQNSFGTICVDYSCPTTANLASRVSLATQVVHAAQFNGQS
ncbi:MAG: hypothetical protein ACP5T4_00600, partial [Candidatus Micrarchaeia archaeon]